MEFQGRSPLKDVARSVLMGAAMIPAAALAACSRNEATPTPADPNSSGGWQNSVADPNAPDAAPATARPRTPPTPPGGTGASMPTRGFAGAPRGGR